MSPVPAPAPAIAGIEDTVLLDICTLSFAPKSGRHLVFP